MGKYSKMKKNMVKFEQPPEWQQEVDQEKNEYRSLNNTQLGVMFSNLKDRKAELEKQIRDINTKIEAINQLLVARMEDDEMTSFKMEDGTTIFIKDEPYCSAQDKHALHQWVREQGLEDLFTLHYQTLSAMVKERLEKGEDLPPGVAVFMKSSIQRRASRA